jgi:hypothetical protein
VLFVSLVLTLAFANAPRSHGQECISIVAESAGSDNRFAQLQLSNAEGCTAIYGLYVQIERNGSIQEITLTPPAWTYGKVEKKAVFWTTDTDPVSSNNKIFDIELQTPQPYTLSWIALDQTLSPIARGTLVM